METKTGTVISFDIYGRFYGYIKHDGGGRKLYTNHHFIAESDRSIDGVPVLLVGQRVTFTVVTSKNIDRAENVRVLPSDIDLEVV